MDLRDAERERERERERDPAFFDLPPFVGLGEDARLRRLPPLRAAMTPEGDARRVDEPLRLCSANVSDDTFDDIF